MPLGNTLRVHKFGWILPPSASMFDIVKFRELHLSYIHPNTNLKPERTYITATGIGVGRVWCWCQYCASIGTGTNVSNK